MHSTEYRIVSVQQLNAHADPCAELELVLCVVLYSAVLCIYTVSQKKGATLTMAITLSILDGFAKFFHCCKQR